MQDAGTVLAVLRERGRKGLPCDELYRQMFNKSLYLGHPGNLGGHETWEDARSWRHRRSTRMSCANAR
jgi:hypothetical protein